MDYLALCEVQGAFIRGGKTGEVTVKLMSALNEIISVMINETVVSIPAPNEKQAEGVSQQTDRKVET